MPDEPVGELVYQEYQLFINGEYVSANSGKTSESLNPATGEVFAIVRQADVNDIDKALNAANKAFPAWRDLLPSAREVLFLKAADVMEARSCKTF
jgi:acyl-CoA reductase-like NAD-dependent aldehyde dehydrogenase